MVQSLGIQKLVSKITGIWTTSDKQWKVQKVEIWWAFVQKKYIPSAKTYTVDLSNITFNYLCVDLPNYLCHFWNHKSFFTTQLLWYLFSSNITYFRQKCKFSDFPLLRLKFTKIVHVIFQMKSQFFFKVSIFFQCHER